jgi:hypothetical protein
MARPDPDRFKGFDVMLPQGARSRYGKAVQLIDKADDLLPDDALTGDAASIRQAIKHLTEAATQLSEMMAYRKMMGVD